MYVVASTPLSEKSKYHIFIISYSKQEINFEEIKQHFQGAYEMLSFLKRFRSFFLEQMSGKKFKVLNTKTKASFRPVWTHIPSN